MWRVLVLILSTDCAKSQEPTTLDEWVAPAITGGFIHGLVIATIDASGSHVTGYGSLGESADAPTDQSIFEIGSLTKTFTTLWLARRVSSGLVTLDEPAQDLLPAAVSVPSRDGVAISLADLATHTSGLPDTPSNLQAADPLNPFATYTVDDLYSFLNAYPLTTVPGRQWSYSNVGVGLLGVALAAPPERDVALGLARNVLDPLGLSATGYPVSANQTAKIAPGHDGDLNPVEAFTFTNALEGAGSLRSTAADLSKYLAAEAGLAPSPLSAEMEMSQQPRVQLGDRLAMGLGWFVGQPPSNAPWPDNICWHNGATGGYSSFLGFDPVGHRGVVVLADTATSGTPTSVFPDLTTSIGVLVLARMQGKKPPPLSTLLPAPVTLSPDDLKHWLGDYAFEDGGSGSVLMKGDHLEVDSPALHPYPVRLYPESRNHFTIRTPTYSRVEFASDSAGGVSVTVTISGHEVRGHRV